MGAASATDLLDTDLPITFHSIGDFEAIVFNDRVAEKLVAGLVELFAGALLVTARQFHFEIFADMDGADALIAHVLEGVLDSLALRVEHRLLRSDDNFGFHFVSACIAGPSKGNVVGKAGGDARNF